MISTIESVLWTFDFAENEFLKWTVPELSSGSRKQFRNSPFHNYFFVANKFQDLLIMNYSPNLDYSFETTHSTTTERWMLCQ